LSQQWVGAIHDGASAFEAVANAAQAAGAVIDSETVAKAAAFDKAWKQSTDTLNRQFKSVLGDTAAALDDLIDKAQAYVNTLNLSTGIKPGEGQDKFDAIADALAVVTKDAQGAAQDLDQVNRVIARYQQSTGEGGDPEIVAKLFSIQAAAQAAADALKQANQQIQQTNFPGGVPLPAARPAAANAPSDNASTLAKRHDDAKDAYDRATASVEKYTSRLQAEADAQGLGSAALEEFKAQALLTTAAQQAGLPITAKMANEIQDLAQDAGLAAEALEKAKVATTISRGQQTSLLSPEDVAIANQLKGLYPDVTQALASTEAQALRTNQAFSQMSSQISNDLTSNLADIATGSVTAAQGFSNMAASILKDIEQMIIKITVVEPLMRAFQQSFTGTGGFLAGLFGGSTTSPAAALAGGTAALAVGGYVSGPGSPTSDSIPARLSNGEFVVNAEATSGHRALLEAINNGSIGYAEGGLVSSPSIAPVSQMSRNTGPSIVYAPTIDARGADVAAVGRLAAAQLQDRQNFERNVLAIVGRQASNKPRSFG
jgi:Mg2+ and Co2+ transporter CorA